MDWPRIYLFPSSKIKDLVYETKLFEDGVIVCDPRCRGFTFYNKCWHVEEVRKHPLGYNDPRLSDTDKHDIRTMAAEGIDCMPGLQSIFPKITPEEAEDLVNHICTQVEL